MLRAFFYFFPDATSAVIAKKRAKELGISDYAFESAEPTFGAISKGPGGHNGGVLYDCRYSQPEGRRGGHYPEQQTWLDCGEFFLGWYTKHPPLEEDLRKEEYLPGHMIELSNEEKWIIPKAFVFTDIIKFQKITPQKYRVVDGKAGWFYDDHYSDLCDIADKWWGAAEELNAKGKGNWPTIKEIVPAVTAIMSHNYRIKEHEIAALDILSSNNYVEIFDAVVDVPGWNELKKKDAATSNT